MTADLQLKAKKGKNAHEFEYYPTPAWMVDVLLDELEKRPVDREAPGNFGPAGMAFDPADLLCEPCVGGGNIVRAIQRRYPNRIVTNDLDPRWPADTHVDAGAGKMYLEGDGIDWVITNPPFSEAARIIPCALDNAPMIAMLLRITWLEPPKTGGRAGFLDAHPPDSMIVLERYNFRQVKGHADSATVAWMLWGVRLRKPIIVVPGHGAEREPLL